jgi:hypothetical protein
MNNLQRKTNLSGFVMRLKVRIEMKIISDGYVHFAKPVMLPFFASEMAEEEKKIAHGYQRIGGIYDGFRNREIIQPLVYADPDHGFIGGFVKSGIDYTITNSLLTRLVCAS